jgi:hypothetical protein
MTTVIVTDFQASEGQKLSLEWIRQFFGVAIHIPSRESSPNSVGMVVFQPWDDPYG